MNLVEDGVLLRTVRILGDHSAARLALDDLKRRRSAGEDAAVYLLAGSYIVGPRILSEGHGEGALAPSEPIEFPPTKGDAE